MTSDSTASRLLESLQLSDTDLDTLDFIAGNRLSNVEHWANNLPVTQINRTATLLYKATPQVSRLRCSADNRLKMLEILRAPVQQNLEGLCRQFVDQPLLHSEAATKSVIISQAIQKHMTNGYCRVANEIISSRTKLKTAEKEKLALSLHRAMTGCCLQLVRSAQIYTTPPSHLWQTLNVLYRVARQLDLTTFRCQDLLLQRNASATIEQVYFRALLLSCSGLNKLNPREIDLVFDACEDWSTLVSLAPSPRDQRDIFTIDLARPDPPTTARAESAEPVITGPNANQVTPIFSNLLDALAKTDRVMSDQKILYLPDHFPAHLLRHLQTAWGTVLARGTPRNRHEINLEVAVGLSAIHYLLAGQKTFQQFRQLSDTRSRFHAAPQASSDPWDSAFDSEGLGRDDFELGFSLDMLETPTESNPSPKKAPVYRVKRLDFSTSGMRLEWSGDIPPQVKTGEIISVIEAGKPPQVGLIRWARQYRSSTQLGIEIIADRAHPVAAQQLKKVGEDGVFMHGLRCTNKHGKSDAELLITASRPFARDDKVRIEEPDGSYTGVLTDQLVSTGSVRQFTLRRSERAADAPPPDSSFQDRF